MILFEEIDFIPFKTSSLPPGPWLVIAPHPDDEALGAGGAILLARLLGISVSVIFVTSGEQGGEPTEREQEARKAAGILGIKKFSFFRFPDRKVYKHFSSLAFKLSKFMTKKYKTIFAPSLQEFHPDHRAVTLAALAAAGPHQNFWLYEVSRQGEVNRLLNIDSVFEEKRKAITCYTSQLKQNRYLELIEALNKARTYTLQDVKFAEGFFVAPAALLLERYASFLKKYFLMNLNENNTS